MKKNFNMMLDIREKKKYWLVLITLVLVFTITNNYFFYAYVGSSVEKDAKQLELILKGDLNYFRTHKISSKKYREHTKIIVEQFHQKAQYNKSINLDYQNAHSKTTGKPKKGYEPIHLKNEKVRVIQSNINIIVPKLNSNTSLEYITDIKKVQLLDKTFLLSVFKSMTLSLTDVFFVDRPKIGLLGGFKKWWRYYRYRSHNTIILYIFLFLLLSRIRKYQIELYKEINRLVSMIPNNQNEDIQKIINCIEAKDINKLKLLIKNGLQIDTKDSEGMTALMLYMLTDITSKNKGDTIKILLDHGADINARNNVGMTSLMICGQQGKESSVEILLANKADPTIKQELTAKDIATEPIIKEMISKTQNTHPQDLVKILSNFTHKPMKFTTHTWDFGSLESAIGTFDETMEVIKLEFKTIEKELQHLSPSLYKKIHTFLFKKNPNLEDSWFSKNDTKINIGWLSLDGLKEHCDSGKNAFDFKLKESIVVGNDEISTFGEVINLFKQEIEIRTDFKNLETMFSDQKKKLGKGFKFSLTDAQLHRQFYTDTQKLNHAIGKIFEEIKKRKDYPTIKLTTKEFDDRSLEIKITQVDSKTNHTSEDLARKVDSGDFADIKEKLNNLCDWSVESVCENGSFRINYLHSKNVIDIESIASVSGFTHILRFYR